MRRSFWFVVAPVRTSDSASYVRTMHFEHRQDAAAERASKHRINGSAGSGAPLCAQTIAATGAASRPCPSERESIARANTFRHLVVAAAVVWRRLSRWQSADRSLPPDALRAAPCRPTIVRPQLSRRSIERAELGPAVRASVRCMDTAQTKSNYVLERSPLRRRIVSQNLGRRRSRRHRGVLKAHAPRTLLIRLGPPRA